MSSTASSGLATAALADELIACHDCNWTGLQALGKQLLVFQHWPSPPAVMAIGSVQALTHVYTEVG